MDVKECPDIICNKGLKNFILSCVDYVRYQGLIDSSTHVLATNGFLQLVRDNCSYEMFIQEIKHNSSIELERSKIWL